MKYLSVILLSLITSLCYSQSRLVINNNGYLVIDNSAFLVLENSNPNALTTLGTGGNIVSEDETDVIQWEIGTTTGTYVIPWTTSSGVKIPLSINKTTAGTGSTAEFILSTWETATDMNAPWPSMVTNMNLLSAVDGSLWVADRFWHVDALSYTAKPDITMVMNYDPAANELGGTNTLVESNLLAQRFNTGLGHWETYKLFGTNDAINDRVTGIVVPAADFYEDWILVDQSNPLPVELLSFEVNCDQGKSEINWITQSEINNDYFIVEKSYDAVVFFELSTVQGAGNSSVVHHYSVDDENPSSGVTYYRLKQVDFDGTETYHQVVPSSCATNSFEVDQLFVNDHTLSLSVRAANDEEIRVYFYDNSGRLILDERQLVTIGDNRLQFNKANLSTGLYLLSIVGENNVYSTKLIKE